jgi:single-strand DNA-binding protein
MSINKVILIGNLGKDPEIRSMGNGNEVASFSIATTESWKDKTSGEKKEKTEWHNIVVFIPGLINVIRNYVKKGTKLYIEGALQTRKWTDNAGIDKYKTEVVLQGYNATMQILDSRNSSGYQSSENIDSQTTQKSDKSEPNEKEFVDETQDDDIPF